MTHPMDYFERIFIINLPSRTDRQAEITAQLKTIGLSLDDANLELFPAVRPDAAEGFPSIGARGCFMSHLGVLRAAQRLRLQRVAILEDDLDFTGDFNTRIQSFIQGLESEDWSLFYGGHRMIPTPLTNLPAGLAKVAPDEAIETCHFMAFQGEVISSAIDYLERILERPAGDPEGGPMHVDGAYNWFRRANPHFKTVLASPELGFQRASRTDIHDLRWYDSTPVVREAVAGLRLLKNALIRR